MPEATKRGSKRRLLRRVLVVTASVCVLVLLVLGIAGPRLVASMTPSIVASLDVPGRLEVETVKLSWLGEISIGHAAIYDADGSTVAAISAKTSGGLLGLLDGDLEDEVLVDGWAHLIFAEDGSTNLERALGLARGAEADAGIDAEKAGEVGRLPISRFVLDGLDIALTRAGAATVGFSGVSGTVETGGQRVAAEVRSTVVLPPDLVQVRADVTRGSSHGSIILEADVSLQDQSGSMVTKLEGITTEAAAALGSLANMDEIERASAVAAEGGLSLDLHASLQDGLPESMVLAGRSSTLSMDVSMREDGDRVVLASPGSITIDSAAFLREDVLRSVIFPADSVRVVDAGKLVVTLDRLVIPMVHLGSNWNMVSAAMRVNIGDSAMVVPGADQEPVRVQLRDALVSLDSPGDGTVSVDARVRAGLEGQDEGQMHVEATAALQQLAKQDGGAGLGPAGLAALIPNATVVIEDMPTIVARPWLDALASAGVDVPEIVGPRVQAELSWARSELGPSVAVMVDAAGLGIDARAQWREEGIVLASPARVRASRPESLLKPWLPEGWTVDQGVSAEVEVAQFMLPGDGFALRLADMEAQATVKATNVTIQRPAQAQLGLSDFEATINAGDESISLELDASPVVGQQRLHLISDLELDGLGSLIEARALPSIGGTLTLTGPTEAFEALDIDTVGRPMHEWLVDGVGPELRVTVDLAQPPEGAILAGTVRVEAEHAMLEGGEVRLGSSGMSVGGATLRVTPSEQLWNGVAPLLDAAGSRLVASSPIIIEAGPASFEFGGNQSIADTLEATSVTIASVDDIRIDGLPVGEPDAEGSRPRTNAVLAELEVDLNSLGLVISGGPGLKGSLATRIDAPGVGPVAIVRGDVASTARGAADATLVVDQLDTGLAIGLAGLGNRAATALDGALGAGGRIEVRASAVVAPAAKKPWTLQRASIDVHMPRLSSAGPIVAEFVPDAIRLSEPVTLAWTPSETWLSEAIGARVTAARPFEIVLDRIDLGNPLGGQIVLLDPQAVFIDAAVRGEGAVFAIQDRPNINLDTLNARVLRTGLSTYSITADASTDGGGQLELNSLLTKPTDEAGRWSLDTAVLRGTLKGDDIPVSLADAMSNTDGLLADSLGPRVDLDAEISNARLIPRQPPSADLRFSVRGPRADASGYGRLENHVISMPEPQTILTVHEVRPEVAERFSQVIPELLLVEKRPEDGPAVLRTEGLAIPTNGDWSNGQGRVIIALGTARFQTTSLLSGVLKATGQRSAGKLGRRIDPFEITMNEGVITYQPFTLPLGDLVIESEGTVDLVNNTMNVLVWLPTAAVSDEAAGMFNTGLGSALGRSIPGFGSVTTLPWRVSGPLSDPSIRPAPRVLIERRSDELLGPLLRPGQTIQDLLGIRGGRDRDGG